MTKKRKGFFKKIVDKLDKRLKEKSKTCCCCGEENKEK